jgi:hypothetical protein
MTRLAGITLLLLQIVSVVHARYVSSRWLAWAPNDYASGYRLQVHVGGRDLSGDEIWSRYHMASEGVYENPVQNLKDMVSQRERTYGRKDKAEVVLTYRPNGGPAQEWQWPAK